MSRTSRKSRPLTLEALGDRALMAASITASLDVTDGILKVEGTYGDDQIHVRHRGGIVSVDGAQIAWTDSSGTRTVPVVPRAAVTKVVVAALDGDDSVQMHEALLPYEAPIPAVIHGNAGDDTLTGGMGNDTIFGEGGVDSILGGSGHDLMYGDANPAAAQVVRDHGLHVDDASHYMNWLGKDEKWVAKKYESTLTWSDYYITPAGEVYNYDTFTWANGAWQPDITDTLVETLDSSYYTDGRKLETEYGLYPYALYYGGGNRGEKWLMGNDNPVGTGWYFVTPQGEVIAWDGRDYTGPAIQATGPAVATLDFSYLADPNELVAAATDDGAADQMNGQDGNDTMYGGAGDDFLKGVAGNDVLYGEAGDDLMDGAADADLMDGGDGTDTLWGGAGNDTQRGGAGADELHGGGDNDDLNGGDDGDQVFGDAGNDVLNGDDILLPGQTGDPGNDTLDGGIGDDHLYGGDGHDVLYGGPNNDYLYGGTGDDDLNGDAGTDLLVGDAGTDLLHGGTGNDTLWGAAAGDNYSYTDGYNGLYGEGDNDNLYGGNGDDHLEGGPGNDGLFGGAGSNILGGGTGADRFLHWSSGDRIADEHKEDAVLTFQDSPALTNVAPPAGWPNTQPYNFNAGTWSEAEIASADVAFNNLYRVVGNTRLLEMPNGTQYTFTRRGKQTSGDYDYKGQNDGAGHLTFSEGYDARLDPDVLDWTLYHEIGHSWLVNDKTVNSHYQAFLDVSGWVQNPTSTTGLIQGTDTDSSTPGNQNPWWYNSVARNMFARDYGKLSIGEDWATTWETYFMDKYQGKFIEGDSKVLAKYNVLDLLFRDLRT